MKCNVGKTDMIFRIIAGILVIAAGYYFKSWWGLIGLTFILTASLKWCPAYLPFKFSTAGGDEPVPEKEEKTEPEE
ncbi:DUF2892 domain-containing protein [candidate division KSB1 bacterium]